MFAKYAKRRLQKILKEHARGEGDGTSNYARRCFEAEHKFINPFRNFEIIKVENEMNTELEILKNEIKMQTFL